MPRLDIVWAVLLAMPAGTFANAHPARDSAKANAGHRQAEVYREWKERDARELAEFERMTIALRDAAGDRMMGRYREVNERLQAAMTREIEQAQIKSAQAMNEARRARMGASMSGGGSGVLPGEKHDDARDRDAALARYEEMARLGTMSTALQNGIARGERTAVRRNILIADKFLALMSSDLSDTRREIREQQAARKTRE